MLFFYGAPNTDSEGKDVGQLGRGKVGEAWGDALGGGKGGGGEKGVERRKTDGDLSLILHSRPLSPSPWAPPARGPSRRA